MNIFAKFKRNDDAINNGKLLVLGYENGAPIGVMVARIHESNTKYETQLNNIKKSRQTELDRIRKADEEQFMKLIEDITGDVICDACIVGFVGLSDENGQPLEFTPENVKRIKNDLPELFEQISQFGLDSKNYVGEFDETESVKN